MAINTERRLKDLENEIKALKATYSLAGGLAKMYVQTSDEFTESGGGQYYHMARFKFTPTYGSGKNNLITLTPIMTYSYVGYIYEVIPKFVIEPQNGTGEVIIRIFDLIDGFKVKIIAVGSSPGTFTKL